MWVGDFGLEGRGASARGARGRTPSPVQNGNRLFLKLLQWPPLDLGRVGRATLSWPGQASRHFGPAGEDMRAWASCFGFFL